jgi:hypothetical protein
MAINIEADSASIGILQFIISVRYWSNPVLEQSGTGLGLIISVPDWSRHWHFFSFQCRTDWMLDSPGAV